MVKLALQLKVILSLDNFPFINQAAHYNKKKVAASIF
jgi:hypothetical protein